MKDRIRKRIKLKIRRTKSSRSERQAIIRREEIREAEQKQNKSSTHTLLQIQLRSQLILLIKFRRFKPLKIIQELLLMIKAATQNYCTIIHTRIHMLLVYKEGIRNCRIWPCKKIPLRLVSPKKGAGCMCVYSCRSFVA